MAKNTILHLGDNRDDGYGRQIHDIFYHFVKSDIIITSNSSFSAMACYFRNNKVTVYDPHAHLKQMPSDRFVITDVQGKIDLKLIKTNFL